MKRSLYGIHLGEIFYFKCNIKKLWFIWTYGHIGGNNHFFFRSRMGNHTEKQWNAVPLSSLFFWTTIAAQGGGESEAGVAAQGRRKKSRGCCQLSSRPCKVYGVTWPGTTDSSAVISRREASTTELLITHIQCLPHAKYFGSLIDPLDHPFYTRHRCTHF